MFIKHQFELNEKPISVLNNFACPIIDLEIYFSKSTFLLQVRADDLGQGADGDTGRDVAGDRLPQEDTRGNQPSEASVDHDIYLTDVSSCCSIIS